MIKTKNEIAENEFLQHQCKWRNHFFGKSGNSYLGASLWDSKDEANEVANKSMSRSKNENLMKAQGTNDVIFSKTTPPMRWSDYSWHMQIPVIE